MDVGATLIADAQPPEAVEPAQGALDDPAVAPERLARLDAAAGDPPPDAPVGRVRPCLRPPGEDGTLPESTETRDHSIGSYSRNSRSSASCTYCQPPASCQSRSRRQQLIPLPQPNSFGSILHGMPLLSTNKIPTSAARSETRGRPL